LRLVPCRAFLLSLRERRRRRRLLLLRLLLLLLLLLVLVLVLLVVVVAAAAAAVRRRRRRRLSARRLAPSWQSWRSASLGVVAWRLDNGIFRLLALPTARSSSMSPR
jgi:Tfp pilus assembly protein PilN